MFLNGVPQKGVYTADEEAGMVIKAKQENGKFVAKKGELQLETKTGEVKIVAC